MDFSLIVSDAGDNTIRVLKPLRKLYAFKNLGNLRAFLEVLKFLTLEEVVSTARVSKQFYEASFHQEMQPLLKVVYVLRAILTQCFH